MATQAEAAIVTIGRPETGGTFWAAAGVDIAETTPWAIGVSLARIHADAVGPTYPGVGTISIPDTPSGFLATSAVFTDQSARAITVIGAAVDAACIHTDPGIITVAVDATAV